MAQPYPALLQIRQQRQGAAWSPGQAGEACGKGKATTLVLMTPVEIKPAPRSGVA
jgi:hypothetical protein